MIEMTLAPSKETDNKLRWVTDVDGVPFQLYIPKWRVPTPWPKRIRVSVREIKRPTSPSIGSKPRDRIVVFVERVRDHTKTVRFAPLGEPKDWQLGQPYIPYQLLPNENVKYLRVDVEWDRSAGVWKE
jgi:hypothetical protein